MHQKLIAPLVSVRTQLRKRQFKDQLVKSKKSNAELKVVIGASGISETGWLASEYGFLNILIEDDWHKSVHDEDNSLALKPICHLFLDL